MLTKITIRNFKNLKDVVIELGSVVIFIGPNNSGKTTALQALWLWHTAIQQWLLKKGNRKERTGTPVNRLDLISIPIPTARLLWHNLTTQTKDQKKIYIEIIVEGISESDSSSWSCGMQFYYANSESLYCQPIKGQSIPLPNEATSLKMALLPTMSGLASEEAKLEIGRINVLIGEGQTAQVLRNLCYKVYSETEYWDELVKNINEQFKIILNEPQTVTGRGSITMDYKTPSGITLDLSASGRGFQQTLLLLSYLYLNQGAILLLDEPDAHLEILRQKQIYALLSNTARKQNSQVIIASHSEIVLNEAVRRKDDVVTFINKPHRLKKSEDLIKSLKDIPFSDYYQISQKGWVLYLEAPSDFDILKAFAKKLNHDVLKELDTAFTYYIGNDEPAIATRHFRGLKEAEPTALGLVLMDRLAQQVEFSEKDDLRKLMWQWKEIENYIFTEEAVIQYISIGLNKGDIFENQELTRRISIINEFISGEMPANARNNFNHTFWRDTKMSDDFLNPLFENYFKSINQYNTFRKKDYYLLVEYLREDQIHPEIIEKLDAIYEVAQRAKPRE